MKIIRCIAIISIIMMMSRSTVFAQGVTGMSYVRGSLAGDQTISSLTYTTLNFVALQEENGTFSSGTFYPTHNGRYIFCASTHWANTSSIATNWRWRLYVAANGTYYEISSVSGLSGATYPGNSGCISLWLLAGSPATFQVFQNTGSNRVVSADPGDTFFTIAETSMIAISQTATPQRTATPNATIPALATIVAGLLTATMEPITETINISLAITNTTGISISRIPVSNTLHTTGYIYLPGWVLNFDPIAVMASLMIFIIVGAVMRKPTLFVISWFGLSILGVFSQSGIYWVFITIVMITAVVIYLFFRHTQES